MNEALMLIGRSYISADSAREQAMKDLHAYFVSELRAAGLDASVVNLGGLRSDYISIRIQLSGFAQPEPQAHVERPEA